VEGTGAFTSGQAQMIMGFAEAQMMKEEGLFKQVGDSLSNFFGLPTVQIVGILAPTATVLDETHLLSVSGFTGLSPQTSLLIQSTPTNELKLFYLYDEETLPLKLQKLINLEKPSYTVDATTYTSLYLGYDEAQMMKNEKLFRKQYDTLTELFGNDIIIAGVAKKTYTLLDMFHFVPKEEWKR
jgi:hypothetical protein